MAELDYVIVGLGNPGAEYEFTPHNLGFLVIDRLAESHGVRVSRKENMSLVGLGTIQGKPVALAKPQTFVNLSGPAVKGLVERYGLDPDRVVLVYDELDLPWASLKIKPKGSDAGHNGVKSVIGSLGTTKIPRVRLGIHPGRPVDGEKFVLAPFRRSQKKEVEEVVGRGAAAVESILAEGVEKSMTIFNRRARGLHQEEE
ncbi:MAG: aminoacyl-tRNA hydrolase [Acidobacteria bacterium]|jgi:PTH1 family peptidyl-tRNA hydrolase|nr:MAG: aminoacyl-tRNA hydrolase [Acidobacteriota bacterium]